MQMYIAKKNHKYVMCERRLRLVEKGKDDSSSGGWWHGCDNCKQYSWEDEYLCGLLNCINVNTLQQAKVAKVKKVKEIHLFLDFDRKPPS